LLRAGRYASRGQVGCPEGSRILSSGKPGHDLNLAGGNSPPDLKTLTGHVPVSPFCALGRLGGNDRHHPVAGILAKHRDAKITLRHSQSRHHPLRIIPFAEPSAGPFVTLGDFVERFHIGYQALIIHPSPAKGTLVPRN
jgi:hypothetical protein